MRIICFIYNFAYFNHQSMALQGGMIPAQQPLYPPQFNGTLGSFMMQIPLILLNVTLHIDGCKPFVGMNMPPNLAQNGAAQQPFPNPPSNIADNMRQNVAASMYKPPFASLLFYLLTLLYKFSTEFDSGTLS